eukprot:gene20869-7754_t
MAAYTEDDNVEKFLQVCDQFKLGSLDTESSNPVTANLSEEVKNDMPKGLNTLKTVEVHALEVLYEKAELLVPLAQEIHKVFTSGHKVFMVGCGATGRLSLALETLT